MKHNNQLNTINNEYDNFSYTLKTLKRAIMKSNLLSKGKMLSRITFSNRQFILYTGGRINREFILSTLVAELCYRIIYENSLNV